MTEKHAPGGRPIETLSETHCASPDARRQMLQQSNDPGLRISQVRCSLHEAAHHHDVCGLIVNMIRCTLVKESSHAHRQSTSVDIGEYFMNGLDIEEPPFGAVLVTPS